MSWTRARRIGVTLTFLELAGDCGWLLADSAGESLADLCDERGTLFTERKPGVWVERGADHPLLAQLTAAGGPIVIPRSGAWRTGPELESGRVEFTPADVAKGPVAKPPRFIARFRLLPAIRSEDASVWLADDPGRAVLAEWLAASPESLLAAFRVARLESGSRRVVLFVGPRGGAVGSPFPGAAGYYPHPRLASLLVPRGLRLSPPARGEALAKAFGLGSREFGLLAARGGRVACERLPITALRPATRLACYVATSPAPLVEPAEDWARLTLPRFVVESESSGALPAVPEPPAKPLPGRRGAWLGRLLPTRVPGPKRAATPPPTVPPVRVLEKLSSPQALTVGNDWVARLAALERRVLAELPRADAPRRCRLWAELGAIYAAVGNPPDAAVSLLNAAWVDPGHDAVQSWLAAERRLARVAQPTTPAAACALAAPKPSASRLACAALAHAAALPSPPAETAARLPELARLIDPSSPDLPARAAWLGLRALDTLTGGDALALARGRDKLFERLTATGPSLDVDAPSFLRFRGVSGERHAAARDWMARVREPLHRWLGKLATPGRLQWAGLDGDPAGTTAYADLMLAWGLAKLGDRARAAELDAQAATALSADSPGADPRVTRLLLDAFRHTAPAPPPTGRADLPGLPSHLRERLASLDELGRYAVNKLRASSAILEPGEMVDPYGGRGVATFLGADALGERLNRFLVAHELLPRTADARELLALGPADPTATTMPRVVFALLEAALRLDADLVAALIPQTVRAVELIPEWVRLSSPLTDPAAVTSRVGRRMVESACHAAVGFHLPESFAAMTEELVRHVDRPDGPGARLAESVAGLYFRALRRLDLKPLAALLLGRLRPGHLVGARELGLAVGAVRRRRRGGRQPGARRRPRPPAGARHRRRPRAHGRGHRLRQCPRRRPAARRPRPARRTVPAPSTWSRPPAPPTAITPSTRCASSTPPSAPPSATSSSSAPACERG